jgi:hypothetical protein
MIVTVEVVQVKSENATIGNQLLIWLKVCVYGRRLSVTNAVVCINLLSEERLFNYGVKVNLCAMVFTHALYSLSSFLAVDGFAALLLSPMDVVDAIAKVVLCLQASVFCIRFPDFKPLVGAEVNSVYHKSWTGGKTNCTSCNLLLSILHVVLRWSFADCVLNMHTLQFIIWKQLLLVCEYCLVPLTVEKPFCASNWLWSEYILLLIIA